MINCTFNPAFIEVVHRNQSICYALALGIDDIMWLYENRNLCTWKTFHTVVTEEDKQEVIKRIEAVNKCVENKTPPNKTSYLTNCAYCDYKERCRRDS